MKALRIVAPNKTQFIDIPQPKPGAGEVLLKVELVGYCGSDLSAYRGKNPMVTLPRIPGHEVAATILQCGPCVPGQCRTGTKVTLSPYTNCYKCPSCRRKRSNACQFNETMGVQRDGALAEYIVAPWQKLHSSNKLSLLELALVEPLAVGFHASARGDVSGKDVVAVLGCGLIGLGAIAAAAKTDRAESVSRGSPRGTEKGNRSNSGILSIIEAKQREGLLCGEAARRRASRLLGASYDLKGRVSKCVCPS